MEIPPEHSRAFTMLTIREQSYAVDREAFFGVFLPHLTIFWSRLVGSIPKLLPEYVLLLNPLV
jgi:hypothetical protein